MLKLDYFKKVVTESNLLENLNWHILAFTIPLIDAEDKWQSAPIRYNLVNKQDGMYFIDIESDNYVLVKIDDYKKDTPLFAYKDIITVDNSWLPTIPSKIETKIGVLIVNAIVLYPSLKHKIPYLNESISVSKIEKILIDKVKNDDKLTANDISVREMVDCIDRLNFLSNLAIITNIAATPKTISPPPNISKIKQELLKEYQDKLNDPVKALEFEAKLTAIDNEYLADDPAAKNILTKKSKKARKKLYLMFGTGLDFNQSISGNKPIINSLTEGIETNPESFPKYINDSRYASFSRGKNTQLAGYVYKILQRSLTNLEITDKECDTTIGLKRVFTKSDYINLINRYIKLNNKWVLIEDTEQAKQYIDKEVEIRSAMFCKSPGNTICYKCLSESYKNNKTAITNIASEMSAVLMTAFLKLMHNVVKETGTLDIKDLTN